jgi:putative membrane protein
MPDGMWGHMGGWGMGPGMVLWSLVAIALLVFIVAATVRLLRPGKDQFTSAAPDPIERAKGVLAERYARGEITQEEYVRRRDAIELLRKL